jgi:hypothetical protein
VCFTCGREDGNLAHLNARLTFSSRPNAPNFSNFRHALLFFHVYALETIDCSPVALSLHPSPNFTSADRVWHLLEYRYLSILASRRLVSLCRMTVGHCSWRLLLAILLMRICLVDADHTWPDKDTLIREIDEVSGDGFESAYRRLSYRTCSIPTNDHDICLSARSQEYSRALQSKKNSGKKGPTPRPSSSLSPTMSARPTGGKKALGGKKAGLPSPTTVFGGKKGLDSSKKTMEPSMSPYPTSIGGKKAFDDGKKGLDSSKKTMEPSMSPYPTSIGGKKAFDDGKKGMDSGKKTMAPSMSPYPTPVGGKKAWGKKVASPGYNPNLGPSPATPAPVPDTPQPVVPVNPTSLPVPNIDTLSPSVEPSSEPSIWPSSQPSIDPSSSAAPSIPATNPDVVVKAQQRNEHHRASRHPGKRLPREHHHHHHQHGDERDTT